MHQDFEKGLETLDDVELMDRDLYLPGGTAFEFLFRTSPLDQQLRIYRKIKEKNLLFKYGRGGSYPDTLLREIIENGASVVANKYEILLIYCHRHDQTY